MGLFNDGYDLKYDNRNETRKFKTSLLSPFSTNIFFKLHQCEDNENPNGKFYISMQINEKQTLFPQCSSNSVLNQFFCPFDEIFQYFNGSAFSFHFDSYCGIEPPCLPYENEISTLKDHINSYEKKNFLILILFSLFVVVFIVTAISYFVYYTKKRKDLSEKNEFDRNLLDNFD
jgi:hypothetical protein